MSNDVFPLIERAGGGNEQNAVYPLYPVAIIVPLIAFPAFILCVPPMIWHFNQRNIAAGSLILWLILMNFFNAINPLIWPRDNMDDWWDGQGLCDIHARVQVAVTVAYAACAGVIARRLANVLDTSNITVAPTRKSRILERVIEVVCCWVLPAIMMIVYYVVQRVRYLIFGISGCVSAFDPSWPSIVLVWMWGPIVTLVASYYAGILIFRLYRYRREFHRLIAARNTSKSRFIRLFFMSIILILGVLPYCVFLLCQLANLVSGEFKWTRVHGDDWNSVVKVPSYGQLRFDRWANIAFGYIVFLLFGTGTDAHNSYKRMFASISLGKIFPRLYVINEGTTASATPSTITFVKGLTSSVSAKARGIFYKSQTDHQTIASVTCNNPTVLEIAATTRPESLHPVSTRDPILPSRAQKSKQSLFSRIFGTKKAPPTLLPISIASSVQPTQTGKSPVGSIQPGVHARAWSNEDLATQMDESDGVQVMHEIRRAHAEKGKDAKTDSCAWV